MVKLRECRLIDRRRKNNALITKIKIKKIYQKHDGLRSL